MLPASHRLRRSDEFRRAVRGGRRSGSRAVVVHLALAPSIAEPARVGFVVNKAVGNAVLRNRVERRLRAVVAGRLDQLPPGSTTVVRALPAAATATYAELEAEIAAALDRLLTPAAGSRRAKAGDQRGGDRAADSRGRGGSAGERVSSRLDPQRVVSPRTVTGARPQTPEARSDAAPDVDQGGAS